MSLKNYHKSNTEWSSKFMKDYWSQPCFTDGTVHNYYCFYEETKNRWTTGDILGNCHVFVILVDSPRGQNIGTELLQSNGKHSKRSSQIRSLTLVFCLLLSKAGIWDICTLENYPASDKYYLWKIYSFRDNYSTIIFSRYWFFFFFFFIFTIFS